MKRKVFIIIFLLFFLLLITVGIALFNINRSKWAKVCFKDNCFNVELAADPESRSRGLMFRDKLEQSKGMLFIFETEGNYSFWMKNTLIPLDIIWINKNNEVVYMAKNAQPCKESSCSSINPQKNAKYVLEINGGLSEKFSFKVGEKIDFEIKK
jgi:hypothetical protein